MKLYSPFDLDILFFIEATKNNKSRNDLKTNSLKFFSLRQELTAKKKNRNLFFDLDFLKDVSKTNNIKTRKRL